ncbi:MAG TPA: hypothetical protein VL614_24245 [Acetobacteraceae bacterium]|jgi:hypothetical protein|nr:hypothetical protein [Acetobacteraceae bacterium]
MAGITLSADEIKAAPPEVRRWLEHEVLRALGLAPAAPAAPHPLVGCNPEEARDLLALIQRMPPVVRVFWELAREGASVAVHGMRAFRTADIQRHVALPEPGQVIECLDVLTSALRRVRGDLEAAFYAVDDQGHCLVAEATMHSIMRLWQEIMAHGEIRQADDVGVA